MVLVIKLLNQIKRRERLVFGPVVSEISVSILKEIDAVSERIREYDELNDLGSDSDSEEEYSRYDESDIRGCVKLCDREFELSDYVVYLKTIRDTKALKAESGHSLVRFFPYWYRHYGALDREKFYHTYFEMLVDIKKANDNGGYKFCVSETVGILDRIRQSEEYVRALDHPCMGDVEGDDLGERLPDDVVGAVGRELSSDLNLDSCP